MKPSKYLIKIGESLHGYNNPELLQVDILVNKEKQPQIYKLLEEGYTVSYKLIDYVEFQLEFKNPQ